MKYIYDDLIGKVNKIFDSLYLSISRYYYDNYKKKQFIFLFLIYSFNIYLLFIYLVWRKVKYHCSENDKSEFFFTF
jgi:hypothetical protein